MTSSKTIKKYIDKIDEILPGITVENADPLVHEILAVLRSDIQGLAQGLSINSADIFSQVDYIHDIKLLRAKLQKEFDAMVENADVNKSTLIREKKLFISHAKKDKDYVGVIITLLESIGFTEDDIICSSIPPYCIPLDNNVYRWLVNRFQNYDLHVIYTLSKTFYSRPACLNEMGATWAMKHKWSAILLPGFNFTDIEGCIDSEQISIKLDDDDKATLNFRLGELKDNLISEFDLRPISAALWERKRDEFLNQIETITNQRMEEILKKNLVDEDNTNIKVTLEKNECLLLVYAADDVNGQIMITKSITKSNPSIFTHDYEFNIDDTAKESAKWKAVIDKLEKYGLIEASNIDRNIFSVTDQGFNAVETINEKLKIDTNKNPHEYYE